MLKTVLIVFLSVINFCGIKADTFLYMSDSVANEAIRLLHNEKEIIIHNTTYNVIFQSIKSVLFKKEVSVGFSFITVQGVGKNGSVWNHSIDLAFTFLKRGDCAVSIAELLGLNDSFYHQKQYENSFQWIERGNDYWIKSKKSILIELYDK